MLDDDFDRVNESGTKLCMATRRDGAECSSLGIVSINSGHYCQAHGWELYRRKQKALARDREAIRREFAQIGKQPDGNVQD